MQMKFIIRILTIVLTASALYAERAPSRIRVATWNVENLFDADDDPANEGDDEFVKGEWRKWSDERYQRKVSHLAEAIVAMKPDVICLQEVENRGVLTDLVNAVRTHPDMHSFTNIVHYDSKDMRGIDVAMISRFPEMSSKLNCKSGFRRGFLTALFDTGGDTRLTLIGCHLKSCLGKAKENARIRLAETKEARGIIDDILKENPNSSLVMLGDFNENADGPSFKNGLFATTNLKFAASAAGKKQGFLYSVLGEIKPAAPGSYYYLPKKTWNTFDSLIIPVSMTRRTPASGPDWRLAAALPNKPNVAVFKFPDAVWTERDGRPKPFRRSHDGTGNKPYVEGYSDHYPVYVELINGQR